MAGAGRTTAGSAARPGINQKAPSKAKRNNARGDFRAKEAKRPADDAGGGVVGMGSPPGLENDQYRQYTI
jgi:hypothetical protein